jgi:hypothetical protein
MADDDNDICFLIYQHVKQETVKAAAAGGASHTPKSASQWKQ